MVQVSRGGASAAARRECKTTSQRDDEWSRASSEITHAVGSAAAARSSSATSDLREERDSADVDVNVRSLSLSHVRRPHKVVTS